MASQQHEEGESSHVYVRHVEGVTDPSQQLRVQVHEGKLLLTVRGETETIPLPDDAYTAGVAARYQRGNLRVEMPRKSPASPAMMEKKLLDPDGPHPRQVSIFLTATGRETLPPTGDKTDPAGHGLPSPAEAEFREHRESLFGDPGVHTRMPRATRPSVVAADAPVVTNPGCIEAAADNLETVVEGGSASRRRTKVYVPQDVDLLAGQVGRAEIAPRGVVVERGRRAEEEGGEEGDERSLDRKAVDYTEEKVGMATRPLEARDFYATATDAGHEPCSSLKAGDEALACDLCRCAPCVCGKMAKSYKHPYELNKAEQKRGDKPELHNRNKPTTGINSHEARDYRMHAKPRDEAHGGIGLRVPPQDWVGNVKMEVPGDVRPDQQQQRAQDAAAHQKSGGRTANVGGREIKPDLLEDHNRAKETATHFMG